MGEKYNARRRQCEDFLGGHGQPGDDVIVPPPGSCGAAMERIANPGKDAYMLDWFMTFKKLAKSLLALPPETEKK